MKRVKLKCVYLSEFLLNCQDLEATRKRSFDEKVTSSYVIAFIRD